MSTTYDLPMPGERFDRGIVVASCWLDDSVEPGSALVLLVRDEPPFYKLVEIEGTAVIARSYHRNINHAVAEYADLGGDV